MGELLKSWIDGGIHYTLVRLLWSQMLQGTALECTFQKTTLKEDAQNCAFLHNENGHLRVVYKSAEIFFTVKRL